MRVNKLNTIFAIIALIFAVGCTATSQTNKAQLQKEISEEELGLRKTNLYSEDDTVPDKREYSKDVAGTSKKIKRAFQDAPPMIPHSVEGMLPIKVNNNQCTACHMPSVAKAMSATPIPKSHFMDFRPKHKYDGKKFEKSVDNMKNEVSIKEISDLAGARFNCSQCHAPQSQMKLAVDSEFEAAYTREDGEFKSRWDEVILEDLDTLKK